jgi:Flp pilus assembly protein CpaB
MRASTLFALSVALVLGLGAAAGAKYLGFFKEKAEANTLVEKPPEKPAPTMVLVAATNLFKGITVTQREVKLRELRKDEEADYITNRKDYLPAIVTSANFRIPTENIPADAPLRSKAFEPQEFGSLSTRIDPYMRAVNVSVKKDNAVGGLIQTGERVDVFITSKITDGSDAQPFQRTALLIRDVKVVAKRDSLMTVLAQNPDDKPLHFTLQTNPYRAALLSYAATHGQISLVPRPKPRSMMMGEPAAPKEGMPNFSDPDSKEYRDENERVAQIEKGEYSVGTFDLARVFQLPEIVQPKPIETMPPPSLRVVTIKGVEQSGETIFGGSGDKSNKKAKPEPKRSYAFYDLNAKIPKSNGGAADAECENCGKGQEL